MLGSLAAAYGLAARACGPAGPTAEQAFLDGRRLSWWKAGLALGAAEISALTLIALPAAAFAGGLGALGAFCGSLAGRAAAAALAPRLREGAPRSPFALLSARLGPQTGKPAALLYCSARALSSALRLVAAAVALSVLTGMPPAWAALLVCAGCAACVGYGGLRAVVATALLQGAVFSTAAALALVYVLSQTPGHVRGVLAALEDSGRLTLADAGPWWSAWPAAAVGALAGFTADFELSQKLLACRSDADARRAVALSAGVAATMLVLLLSLGAALLGFYHAHPALAVPERLDLIFPHFAATVLPPPLRGLAAGALAMAALDLPLSSLSAATWWDVAAEGRELPAPARWTLAGGWAAALWTAALVMAGSETWAAAGEWAWAAAAGPLLGLLLSCWLKRPPRGWLAAAAAAAGLAAGAWLASEGVEAGWITAVGAALVAGAGYAAPRQ